MSYIPYTPTPKKGKNHFIATRQNKLRRLEQIYKRLYKASEKAEKAGKARSSFFHIKFPKFEDYLKTIKIKEVSNG